MIYLASPYTHENPLVMEARFKCAAMATASLMREGLAIFSPIVNCHYLATHHELPRTFEFWQKFNFDMLSHSERLIVLTLDGWKDSVGVAGEIAYARDNEIPTEFRYIKEFCFG